MWEVVSRALCLSGARSTQASLKVLMKTLSPYLTAGLLLYTYSTNAPLKRTTGCMLVGLYVTTFLLPWLKFSQDTFSKCTQMTTSWQWCKDLATCTISLRSSVNQESRKHSLQEDSTGEPPMKVHEGLCLLVSYYKGVNVHVANEVHLGAEISLHVSGYNGL